MLREASGEDATKKKPVDSEKDALKSRKQMEDSRQVLILCLSLYYIILWGSVTRLNQQHQNRNGNVHLRQVKDERILQKEEVSLINHAILKVYNKMYLEKI